MSVVQPKVFKYNEDGKLFLRAFLLDGTTNKNHWRVTEASIPQNIRTFIGAPLVLSQNYDHPPWVAGGTVTNVQFQERYRIGDIVDVVAKEGRYDAIIEITDPLAREAIENNDIPFYVSPKLIHNPRQPDYAISEWMGLHLAIVDNPAYGVKASVEGACYGAAEECKVALKQASTTKESCGFCVKQALLALVTKQANSSLTSLEPEAENLQEVMSATAVPAPVIDQSNFVSKTEYDSLKSQFDVLKSVAEESKKAFDAKIAGFEEERRTEKITAAVKAKVSDVTKAGELVSKFVQAKYSPESVAEILSLIPEPKDNTEKFTAPVQASTAASSKPGYEAYRSYVNSVVKGAL